MRITCPNCQFSREVDESRIPAGSRLATCPKCQTKFEFRTPDENFGFDGARDEKGAREDAVVEAMAEPRRHVADQSRPEPAHSAPDEDVTELTDVVEEPDAEEPRDAQAPTETPAHEPGDEEPLFPNLRHPDSEPDADREETIWDRLGGMTPPHQEPEPRRRPVARDDGPEPTPYIEPPFERLDKYGFFVGAYETLKRILFSPVLFFQVMPLGGGVGRPLAFGLLMGAVQLVMQSVWEIVGVTQTASVEGVQTVAGWSGLLLALIAFPFFASAAMFLASGVYHLLLMLFGAAKGGFEATFRAGAYANAPIILGIFPMPTLEIQYAWMVLATIWGVIITVIGWKHLHKTTYARVIPAALLPLLLGAIAYWRLVQSGMPMI